jgi:hypothetical protein
VPVERKRIKREIVMSLDEFNKFKKAEESGDVPMEETNQIQTKTGVGGQVINPHPPEDKKD